MLHNLLLPVYCVPRNLMKEKTFQVLAPISQDEDGS